MEMTDTAFAVYDRTVPRGLHSRQEWQMDEAGAREARIESFL